MKLHADRQKGQRADVRALYTEEWNKQNQTRLNLVCEKHTEKEAARHRSRLKVRNTATHPPRSPPGGCAPLGLDPPLFFYYYYDDDDDYYYYYHYYLDCCYSTTTTITDSFLFF